MIASNSSKPFYKRHIHPALALWLIAPIFGELFSGSLPLNEYLSPLTILTMGMLYGSGAILIREIVTRWQKGWGSLLLLGMAYGIYEEGLVVRFHSFGSWHCHTTNGQYPVMYFSNPVFLALLGWIYYRVNRRVKSDNESAMLQTTQG